MTFEIALPGGLFVRLEEERVPRALLSEGGLRRFLRERHDLDVVVLHHAEALHAIARPVVRLEALTVPAGHSRAVAASSPLAHARPWQEPGWFAGASAWLGQAVRSSGDEVTGEVEQVSTYDRACILHVPTRRGGAFLKAGHSGQEAIITLRAARADPDAVVTVLAVDEARDWLVTAAGGMRLSDVADIHVWRDAVRSLLRLQRKVTSEAPLLEGASHWLFAMLPRQLAALANGDVLVREWGQDEVIVRRLRAALAGIETAHARVATLGLSECWLHGDAQPMNALHDGQRTRWFDWSEASVAHPLLDVGWLLAWLAVDARATLPVRRTCPGVVDVLWGDALNALGVADVPLRWQDVRIVALAHRVVTYEQRFRSWQGTVAGVKPYVPYYLGLLLKSVETAHHWE